MATGILRRLALAPPAPAEPSAGSLSIHQVYEAHFRYVWRTLRGLGVAEHAVEDAAHDVFMVVQRKLDDFDGEQAKLTTWLYEIALRVARRYRAQSAKEVQRRVALAPVPDDPERSEDPAPLVSIDLQCSLEQSERLALARRALDALDPEKREAFVLACIEQRSAPEIAEITGVPLNTVYSRLRAARRTFAEAVARLEPAASRRAR
jgi:RNA polymerase sigma-70 factor, ECF subfamily